MKITFTTVDGKTINASDKNVLAQYAAKGKITPNTVIVVDGISYYAGNIPGLFVSPVGNSASPPSQTIIVETEEKEKKGCCLGVCLIFIGLGLCGTGPGAILGVILFILGIVSLCK